MDRNTVDTFLDTLASMSVVIDKLGQDLEQINDLDERKALSPHLKDFLKSFYNLRDQFSFKYPELHPDFLGLENYSKLRKKYETSDVKVTMPTKEEIEKAANLWQRLQKLKRK
jgi:hypothetical protein